MPTLDWNTILAALGYAALTGIFNLIFARKSQIEAWAESRPRLAAILKLTRSLGFDPWNALSALSLMFKSKLPEIQKSDSTIARVEQRKADEKRLGPTSIIPPAMMLMLCFVALLGCNPRKPPCDESKLRAIDARYIERVGATCLTKYSYADDCPEYPALKAQHRAELREACPQ
jgi:hypothetical protein